MRLEKQGEQQKTKTDLIMWKPVSEYMGGRVLATNDVDILVGYINSDGDCESEDCEGTLLCGITGFVEIEDVLPPKQDIVQQLTAFAQHLQKRGAFRDDLCMDFEHEAQSFIELQKPKKL